MNKRENKALVFVYPHKYAPQDFDEVTLQGHVNSRALSVKLHLMQCSLALSSQHVHWNTEPCAELVETIRTGVG